MAEERPSRYHGIARTLAIVGTVALVGSTVIYWAVLHRYGGISPDSTDWGSFGAFITGVAGTIIALATLIALAMTLDLQARELLLSRNLIAKQARTLERQAMEGTFFQLLANRRNSIDSLGVGDDVGRNALNVITSALAADIQQHQQATDTGRAELSGRVVSKLSGYRPQLDPVIGSTIQLLHFVLDIDAEAEDDAPDYWAIAQADFSIVDQVLFLYVGLSEYGQQFGVFDVIREAEVLNGLKTNSYGSAISQKWLDQYQRGGP